MYSKQFPELQVTSLNFFKKKNIVNNFQNTQSS